MVNTWNNWKVFDKHVKACTWKKKEVKKWVKSLVTSVWCAIFKRGNTVLVYNEVLSDSHVWITAAMSEILSPSADTFCLSLCGPCGLRTYRWRQSDQICSNWFYNGNDKFIKKMINRLNNFLSKNVHDSLVLASQIGIFAGFFLFFYDGNKIFEVQLQCLVH